VASQIEPNTAWYHKLVPKTCNPSTQTWLERRPLEFHDAIAYIIGGKRFKATGSGGDSDYLQRAGKNFQSGFWIATVIPGNAQRLEMPVAKRTEDRVHPRSWGNLDISADKVPPGN